MHIPRGTGRSIALIIFCLYLLIVSAYASESSPSSNSSLSLSNASIIPVPVSNGNPVQEISSNPDYPDLTSSPTIKSSIIRSTANNGRIAPLNPDFITYQQNTAAKSNSFLLQRSVFSETPSHGLGFIPLTIDLSSTKGKDVTGYIGSYPVSENFFLEGERYPSRFDLRTIAKVTTVKDQGDAGSCWAFASYASLESTLLPNESSDFSENHMKNLLSSAYPDGFDRLASGGGNAQMSTAYLSRWTGPIRDLDDPYVASSNTSPTDIPSVKHVQNVLFLPDRANATDNNNIKTALMTHGVVYTSMYLDDLYFNRIYNASYYPFLVYDSLHPNHAVGIVGWDDNYSKENFTIVPPANGAFIIKNSWGTGWGEEGFFYISYYDTYIGKNNAVFTAESSGNYDRIYQYDPLGWVINFGNYVNPYTQWGANIFTSNSSETISAVSFYTTDTNTSYDLYIYKNPDNGPINISGYSYQEKGIIAGPPGYYTKAISPGISLQTNDRFSVVVNLTTPNIPYPLPIENKQRDYSSQAAANAGESFYSDDNGQTWLDITTYDPSANICFKAFTIFTPPTAAFSANVVFGHVPLTVEFTDNSSGSPTAWNWSFGDGNSTNSTMQNPIHTYLSGGRYTVSLTASNLGRSNTTTKTKYISIIGGNDGIAIFRPSTGYWYFDYNLDGIADNSFRYGGTGDQIIKGNWQGLEADGIAIFRPSTGYWYFDYNLDGIVNNSFRYGGTGDQIIKGNWQGTNDGIAIFRPSTGYWYFDYNLDGIVDNSFRYGGTGDQIIKGNWQGTNDGIAIFRPSTGYWYFDYNLDGIVDNSFRYGGADDQIIKGNWQGTNDGIAIFRPSTGYWYFDYNLDGTVDKSFRFGGSTDMIIKGDWDGDGKDGIGIFRPSTGYWYFDYNLDGMVDKSFRFGGNTDQVLVGKWA
jgi:C1A family cysteine protease